MPTGMIAGERIRALAGGTVPGIAVVVAGPEGLRAAGAAGLADIGAHRPASLSMVCPWFSMTKIVTATAAVRLAERGVLDLDAPADELARFLRLHLQDGELDGTRILSPQAAAAMRQITVPGRRYDLGLGWFRPARQRKADPPFVEHLGGGAGFFNLIRIYPTRGVGVAVMGNATTYTIDAIARLALAH